MLELLHKNDPELFESDFFGQYRSEPVGATIRKVKPVARYKGDVIELKYNVGARGNGVDNPVWPNDLMLEVVR